MNRYQEHLVVFSGALIDFLFTVIAIGIIYAFLGAIKSNNKKNKKDGE